MVLIFFFFFAVIRRESAFVFRFPFCGHFPIISSIMSLIYRMIYPYSCFSSDFCFLGFFFVVFLSKLLLPMLLFISCCNSFFTFFNERRGLLFFLLLFILLFLHAYCLSLWSRGNRALHIFINFLSIGPFIWVPPLSILGMVFKKGIIAIIIIVIFF